MNRIVALISLMAAGVAVCTAESSDERSKLWGKWATQSQASPEPVLWVLEEDNGKLKVEQLQADEKKLDVDCNTMGRDCKSKVDGKDATVSFYFNGPTLVEWEKVNGKVVRRRFHVVNEGKNLEIESTSIVPQSKPETVTLQRASDQGTLASK